MADTQRTLAALLTLLADNSTGAISAQDVRDMLVSVAGGYGGLGLTDGSAAQTLVATTAAKFTGFDATRPSSGVTPSTGNDELTIDDADADYSISAALTFSIDTAADVEVSVVKNDSVTLFKSGAIAVASGEVARVELDDIAALAAGDTLQVYVESDTAGDLTGQQASLKAKRLN